MSDDYTPTTDDLREWYISEHVVSPELGSKEWADGLAAHDAEVAAKALRDAANVLIEEFGEYAGLGYHGESDWLRGRASAFGTADERDEPTAAYLLGLNAGMKR